MEEPLTSFSFVDIAHRPHLLTCWSLTSIINYHNSAEISHVWLHLHCINDDTNNGIFLLLVQGLSNQSSRQQGQYAG